jgi:hypothetical protein
VLLLDLLEVDGCVHLLQLARVELVEGVVEQTLSDPSVPLLEELVEFAAHCFGGLAVRRVPEGLVVFAGHVEDEVVVDFLVDLLDLVRSLGVSAQTARVVTSVLHGNLRMLTQVLLVCAKIMEF